MTGSEHEITQIRLGAIQAAAIDTCTLPFRCRKRSDDAASLLSYISNSGRFKVGKREIHFFLLDFPLWSCFLCIFYRPSDVQKRLLSQIQKLRTSSIVSTLYIRSAKKKMRPILFSNEKNRPALCGRCFHPVLLQVMRDPAT